MVEGISMDFSIIKFKIIRSLIHFFLKNLQIKNNRILFASFRGKEYSCNPKVISEYLQSNGKINYEIIWAGQGIKNIPQNIKTVDCKSLKYIYYYFTSKWIVTNCEFKNSCKKPKGQYRLETWHGGGAYKKVNTSKETRRYRLAASGSDIDYFISSCTKFSDVMACDKYVDREKFLEIGMPRNDVFFNKDSVLSLKKKVEDFLGLEGCRVVLYAPTWRDDGATADTEEVYRAVHFLNQNTKQKYRLLCRAHHRGKLNGLKNEVIDVTSYPNMQELLCAADILITDYSSCMWDFSLMYKPCFIYATDIKKYEQDRDFYTPMSEWPFPIATNFTELVNNIMDFNESKYLCDVKRHHRDLGACEDGHACEKICKIIEDKCWEGAKNI